MTGKPVFQHAGARTLAGYSGRKSQGHCLCSHVRRRATEYWRPCRADLPGVRVARCQEARGRGSQVSVVMLW